MSDSFFDEFRGLGFKLSKDEQRAADLQEVIWRSIRQREAMDETGEDTTLIDILIERSEQELKVAIEKIK